MLKIIFFGTPHFVVPVLEMLYKNHQVVGVVTAPDTKVGRKQIMTPTPVAKFADEHNIAVFKPKSLSKDNLKSLIINLKADLFIVAAFGKIIPQSVLDIPKYGALNIHPSSLPRYRGPSPLQTAILKGDTQSAITIMKMDAEMDHGSIVKTEGFRLSEQDTFETLSTKAFLEAIPLLREIIPEFIHGTIPLQEQDHSKATYTKIITKDDGYFDINNPPSPESLDRMIRAYYSWPGVWTRWNGKIVKFLPKEAVQMEGKKPMLLKDFLNGYPHFPNPFSRP